jgi:hypothetical protein
MFPPIKELPVDFTSVKLPILPLITLVDELKFTPFFPGTEPPPKITKSEILSCCAIAIDDVWRTINRLKNNLQLLK